MCSPQAGSRYIAAASERQAQPQPRALMRSRCSPLFRRSQPDVGLRCRLARSSCRHCCGARRAKRSCGARRAKRTYRWSHGSPTEGCRGWSRLCGSRLPSCERDEQFSRRPDIDFGDGHFGAFACEQDGGGAADPSAGAGDERYLSCEPWHRSFPWPSVLGPSLAVSSTRAHELPGLTSHSHRRATRSKDERHGPVMAPGWRKTARRARPSGWEMWRQARVRAASPGSGAIRSGSVIVASIHVTSIARSAIRWRA